MKKFTLIFTLGLFVSLVGIMSCGDGGSDEDRQKAIQDSIREADSLAALDAARIADSIAAADSAWIADSLAALEEGDTPGKKPTPKPTTTSNDGGDDKPVVEDPKPSTVNTNPGKPGKDDRGGNDNSGKPSKGDRNNTGDGDGKTGTSKPGKRDR